MTDRELFKKALDALDIAHRRHGFVDITVMTSLHSRLAQPEQEPVAWIDADGDVYRKEPSPNWCPPHRPLYTAPQTQRKPLTQQEFDAATDAQYTHKELNQQGMK